MGTAASIANLAQTHFTTRLYLGKQHLKDLKQDATVHTKNILFVTSEYSDLIKAGGLGDVSSALPKALLKRNDVRILIPGYKQVVESGHAISVVDELPAYAHLPSCKIGRLQIDKGPIIYVVLAPELYEREGNPYGDEKGKDWDDNPIRFARFSLAAAEIARGRNSLNWQPELVHTHDWPAALTSAYMKWQGQHTPSVFTIHNLAHQGLCAPEYLEKLGLQSDALTIDSMEFYGQLSFMKAGINFANHITTVSETYAQEITQPEFGCGLHGLLKQKFDQHLLSGITNGIDDSWEPDSDPHLVESFKARKWHGKHANTRYLEHLFNLKPSSAPLFAVVSRLAHQKGLDLTLRIAEVIVKAGGRLIVMGTGEKKIEKELLHLAERHPNHIGVHIGFNEAEARRIFAGSDFLLMPSRFEPCGLSQMYAQRFGSLPIAHRTGGLADTIDDGLNGFLFSDLTIESYARAVHRALHVFKHRELLCAMRCHAMASPMYWKQSVLPYDQLYSRLINENQTNVKNSEQVEINSEMEKFEFKDRRHRERRDPINRAYTYKIYSDNRVNRRQA
ncbi:MAG: glycogen synthase GlgA [Gammaproteobacteria bacterium]|nr:MAG: glycogen synthase GlgA [Gammaproteobacteria bacterium]